MRIRLIPITTVVDRCGVCKATVYRRLQDPASGFPRPTKHGRRTLWVESEVNAFLTRLVGARASV